MKPLFIGFSEDGERIELTDEDLQTHVHGIGATRTGKSKMIEWLARELVRRKQGFCLIDPHGTLYDDLLRWLTYLQPNREILLFNPSFDQRIVGFNPFHSQYGDVSTQADRRVKATIKAWGATSTDETPRLERWLRSFYHVLIERGYSLEVARYFFSFKEKQIRDYLTQSIESDLIRNEFDELSQHTRFRDFSEQIESAKNRLFRFLAPRQVRRIMGLDFNNLDLRSIIEEGKILLVNLQRSDILTLENSRLIGTLLLNEFWEVASRRKQTASGRKPSDFFLIIDEFQMFLTPDIPEMLDQAAKYGLHLMLFHQRLSQLKQLDEQAFGAVNNARVKLVYGGLSDEDAQLIVREIFPGQIDLKRIKFLIEQTKFWPRVDRALVYTKGSGGGSAKGHASGTGSGSSTGSSAGISVGPSWPINDPTTHYDGTSYGDFSSSSVSDSESTYDSWSEGEADVPFIYPEAFKEISSITSYTLEEMIWQLASRLREQYQRHFMIRRPGKPTVAGVTPFVKTFYATPERIQAFTEKCLHGFLTASEVDHEIENIHRQLFLKAAPEKPELKLEDFKPDDIWEAPLDTEAQK